MNKTAQRGFRIVVTTYQCHYSCPANEQSGNATINADSETAAESECVATQATEWRVSQSAPLLPGGWVKSTRPNETANPA